MKTKNRNRIRILMAKPGLDGHVVGLLQVSNSLRNHGYEVIMGGVRLTPEQIVQAAIQEDVKVVGLSILSGAHMSIVPKVIQLLKEQNAQDIMVLVGGVIPPAHEKIMLEMGVSACFVPGTMIEDIVKHLDSKLL